MSQNNLAPPSPLRPQQGSTGTGGGTKGGGRASPASGTSQTYTSQQSDDSAYESDFTPPTQKILVPIDKQWHFSSALSGGRRFLQELFPTGTRVTGILDRPTFPRNMHVQQVEFKVCMLGKSGVGKTTTACNLTGLSLPRTHVETAGSQVRHAYWPVRLPNSGKVYAVRYKFWDMGGVAMKKFDYLVQAAAEEVDAILYCFSLTDRSSFDDLPQLIADERFASSHMTTPPVRMLIGTKSDSLAQCQVTEREVGQMSARMGIPAYQITNFPPDVDVVDNELREIAHHFPTTSDGVILLNDLAELLLNREE